jgi:hypothetical protein
VYGELAQLVERCDRTAEVRGSSPLFSIGKDRHPKSTSTEGQHTYINPHAVTESCTDSPCPKLFSSLPSDLCASLLPHAQFTHITRTIKHLLFTVSLRSTPAILSHFSCHFKNRFKGFQSLKGIIEDCEILIIPNESPINIMFQSLKGILEDCERTG